MFSIRSDDGDDRQCTVGDLDRRTLIWTGGAPFPLLNCPPG
jgi:hypothetical protein